MSDEIKKKISQGKVTPAKHLRDFKHPLRSRRDFLTHGLLAFGAMATAPSFASRLMKRAAAAGGKLDASAGPIPFMAFDMAGGGSLHGNFLAGKAGGPQDLLASYDTLGWNPRESGSLNVDFGLPMSAKYSKILAGILQNASAGARANLRMGSFCHNVAAFDSPANPLNSSILVLKAGCKGQFIPGASGIIDSLSGGNSAGAQEAQTYKPIVVNSINDLLSSVSFGGVANSKLSVNQLKALAQGSVDLSAAQLQPLSSSRDGYTLAVAAKPAYAHSLQLLSNIQGLDPRQDTDAQNVYQISANTGVSDPAAIVAGLVSTTIKGNSGPSTWTLGNCDYHSGDSAQGDGQDLLMGQQIGLAVEYAYRVKRPFFFQIITDGSCTADSGTRNWIADAFACMTIIGYFNPDAPPNYVMDGKQPRLQVGNFTDAQSPDTGTLVGANPDFVAYAVLANYLNVSGRLGDFAVLAPGTLDSKQLDSVLIFDSPKARS